MKKKRGQDIEAALAGEKMRQKPGAKATAPKNRSKTKPQENN